MTILRTRFLTSLKNLMIVSLPLAVWFIFIFAPSQATAANVDKWLNGGPPTGGKYISDECRTKGQCSAGDRGYIQKAIVECSQRGCTPEEQKMLDAFLANIRSKPDNTLLPSQGGTETCEEGSWSNAVSPKCWVRTLFSWIGGWFIFVGVKIATVAGGIFEAAIKYTIVELGKYLQLIKPAIDAGWTGLRDIANIVIIGLFVFVAINIILGVKEFGEKKAVAKILIIAVLINFSLLFTKVIVDASNFTAYQFYNSMVKGVDAKVNQTVGSGDFAASVTSSGITASFMQFLGIEGFNDSSGKLRKIAENNQDALYALGYGFMSFIFLLAVAVVFLYGAFLIISRAVLIVFLMLTSALAFASWIIPHQFISDGWEKWWKSLLKSAFFAPILMAFLWMTLRVSQELSNALTKGAGPGAKGTLGALAQNASSEANIVALLNFAFILGLLYASIATANMFSSSISGFRFASAVAATPFVSVSRAGGFLGRNIFGWSAQRRLESRQEHYWDPNHPERRQGLQGRWNRGIMRAANYLATSRYDLLQKAPVKAAAGYAGGPLTSALMQKTEGITKSDFRTMMEKKAQAADALARSAFGPSAGQRAVLEQHAQQQMQPQIDALQRTLRDERSAADQNARRAQVDRPIAEARAAAHEEAIQRGENEKAVARSRHESEMRTEQDRITRAQRDAEHQAPGGQLTDAELERIRAPLRAIQQAQERELAAIDERTRQHRADLQIARETVEGLNREAAEAAARAPQVREAERALQAFGTAADRVAREEVRLREQLLWDPRARPMVAGEMRGQAGRAALRAMAAEIQRTGVPPSPAAPAAPPRT